MKKIILLIIVGFIQIPTFSQKTGTFTDSRDGRTYKTVKIGEQVWMAENLAFKVDSECWAYEDDLTKVINYGYLYNWETANNICPVGWHLPDKVEFEILLNVLDNSGNEPYKVLEHYGNSEFCRYLGGHRTIYGYFVFLDMYMYFWSSSQVDNDHAWRLLLCPDNPEVSLFKSHISCGFSVRCIKDI